MTFEKITFDVKDKVAIISLNMPKRLNALDTAMIDELSAALDKAENEARAIIIRANGKGFCSGWNIAGKGFDPSSSTYDAGGVLESHVNAFMKRLGTLSIPFITSVHGAAVGAGCALALSGDMIVASENAYFLQAFTKIGLVPDAGATHMLVRTLGRARAMELVLRAQKLPAQTALDWGLINKVAPNDELNTQTLELAKELADGAKSLAIARKMVWDALDTSFDDMLDVERHSQKMAGNTKDHVEGIMAFAAKRKANFTGA